MSANELTKPQENYLIPQIEWSSNDDIINQVDPKDLESRKITRQLIDDLEESMKSSLSDELSQPENGVLTHYHTKGIYARELFIPKGSVMVSKLHKLPRLCMILSGDVSFTTEYGSRRIKGPYTAVFPAGSKVALFTHEDTIWTAIHGTDETDLDVIENNLIAKDHNEYNKFCASIGLEEGGE